MVYMGTCGSDGFGILAILVESWVFFALALGIIFYKELFFRIKIDKFVVLL